MASERALGKAAETGEDDATTEMLAAPFATQEFNAAEVPGVTCWKALFWSTGGIVDQLREAQSREMSLTLSIKPTISALKWGE